MRSFFIFFQKTTHTLCALSRGREEGVNDYLLVVIVVVEKEYYNYIISILSLAYIYIITSLLCPESGVWCPRKWVSEPRKWGFEHGKWGLHPKKWVSEPKKWVSLLEKFMSYQHSEGELSTFRKTSFQHFRIGYAAEIKASKKGRVGVFVINA
jgi:hypothetical protein